MAKGKLFVVHAEAVEDGRVEVVHVHFVFLGKVAELIRRTVDDPRLDPAAGHPNGEAVRMMIATETRTTSLRHWRPPELTAPDHQRFIQQTALLEVADQGRDGPVHSTAALGVLRRNLPMRVPALFVQLDKTHATFTETPRQ